MSKKFGALIWALIVGMLIVAVGLSFLFGFDNPVSWVLLVLVLIIPFAYKKFSKGNEVVWNDSYSVGVEALDNDHKKLIQLLNQFQTAHDYHTGEAFEKQSLEELIAYTKYHFKHEEELMEEHGYQSLEAHKEQHQAMISEVERFVVDYEARGHEALAGVSDYLTGWLINHINGTDKQYTAFMHEKGVY